MAYLAIAVTLSLARIVVSYECDFEGNICDADAQCMGDISNGYGCYDMTHKKVYKSSSPKKFSVNISEMTTYPDDVAITVLREYNGEYTIVPQCCNMKSNEVCMLPPTDEAIYYIVAPVLVREIDFLIPPPFCSQDVFVIDNDKPLLWCFIDENAPCKYVQHDKTLVNETFIGLSTSSWQTNLTYDLCMFDVPIMKADGFRYFHDDGLSYGVKNVDINSDDMCDEEGNGRIVKNLNRREYLDEFKERAPPGYTRCAFEKENGFSNTPSWSARPTCHANGTPDSFPGWSIVIVSIVVALIFILIIAVVYKRYAKSWFPNYKVSLQITEVLPSITEIDKGEKSKEMVFILNGTKHIEDKSTKERYTKTPVHSAKSTVQTIDDKQETINTVFPISNCDVPKTIHEVFENYDATQQKDAFYENNTVANTVNNNDDNFGYMPKHMEPGDSLKNEQNINFPDFNANSISSKNPDRRDLTNITFSNPITEHAVSHSCDSAYTGKKTETKQSDIIFSSPWKTKTLPLVESTQPDFNCTEGYYVKKYDNDMV